MKDLPAIGLGCATLGLSSVSEAEAAATLQSALSRGIRYFDTSPLYGAGLSEKRLGRTLAKASESAIVSTKVGYELNFPEGERAPPGLRRKNYGAEFVRSSVEESLDRLGLSSLDLVLIHDPDGPHDCEEAVAALLEMKSAGVLRGIGVGVNCAEIGLEMARRYPLDAVLVAGRYTLLDRSASDKLLPHANATGLPVVVAGVFSSGILANADPSTSTVDYRPADPTTLARVKAMKNVADANNISLTAAALQFVARLGSGHTLLLGAGSVSSLDECLDALSQAVPDRVIDAIAEAGA